MNQATRYKPCNLTDERLAQLLMYAGMPPNDNRGQNYKMRMTLLHLLGVKGSDETMPPRSAMDQYVDTVLQGIDLMMPGTPDKLRYEMTVEFIDYARKYQP